MNNHHWTMMHIKRRRRKRIFWFLVFPLLLVLGMTASYGAYLYKKTESMMGSSYLDLDAMANQVYGIKKSIQTSITYPFYLLVLTIVKSETMEIVHDPMHLCLQHSMKKKNR